MLALTALTLLTVAGAQQLKPFTVDKVSAQNGLLVYKGVSYISLDLLQKAGATAGKQTLFVYAQPIPNGPPLKLSGCLNEKLYNNAFYLTAQAPVLEASTKEGRGPVWRIPLVVQSITNLRIENVGDSFATPDVDLNDVLLIYKDGSRFMQRSTPMGTVTSRSGESGYAPAKVLTSVWLYFNKDENELEANPPVKLILPQAHIMYGSTFAGMTIDLTCTK